MNPSTPPMTPAPALTEVEQDLLQAVAMPLAVLSPDGTVVGVNPALERLCGGDSPRGRPSSHWLRPDPAYEHSAAEATGTLHAGDRTIPVRWTTQVMSGRDGLRVLTITDLRTELAQRARLDRMVAVLDLVQDHGRVGLWERDVRDLSGWWDKHLFRIWGLPQEADAPSFEQLAPAIVPEEREAHMNSFRASLAQPGRYSQRYRVRDRDGGLRWLHSQWTVVAGPDGRPERALGIVTDDTEALQRAQAMDEANVQLRLAVDLADLAIWRHDLLTDRVQFSAKAWQVLGLPPRDDELTLQEVRARVHPDDLPAVLASVEQALTADKPVDTRARYRRDDGSWRHLLTRRAVQRDALGRAVAFIGVTLDLTDQNERAQRELELAEHLDLVASAAGVASWTLDVTRDRAQWNEQMRSLHGLGSEEEVPGLAAYAERFLLPEDRQAFRRTYAELVAQGEAQFRGDGRIRRADGSIRRVVSCVRVTRAPHGPQMHGAVLDLTERLAAELALRLASERAALAVRGAGMGTWDYDLTSDRGLWDEQMWRLRGLEPRGTEAPDEASRLALVHPDDRAPLRREHEQANRERRPSRFEFRVLWPDGRQRWLATRSVPQYDERGQLTRRIGVNWDITDARDAEAARQAELLAQRESQAKSSFLARMSHELRTPLNAVIGFTQLLQIEGPGVDPEKRQRQLDHIRLAGEHLLALINDALDLSTLESGEMRLELQALDPEPLVRSTLPLVQELASGLGVTVRIGPLPASVQADATRLRQVLLNLLSNAIKYNRPGGRVQVDGALEDGRAVLRVADTGRGFSAEQLAHAFEPFNRLGAERDGIEGTGIGLAIVKAIVEGMGGQVGVTSRPGEGSTFEVRLHSGVAPAPGRVAPAPAPPAAHLTANLLYIEDNQVNALIVREIVARRPGITLEVAETGAAGVQAAHRLQPSLVLVDMQLPDFDGHEVLRRLRADAATRDIPCIAVSANAMPADIERALAAGFSDYWTKPLSMDAFLGALDRLLG